MTTCKHLTAYEDSPHLAACMWPDAHPERFLSAPRWLSSWALSGGPNFNPKQHCPGCPGFCAGEPERLPERLRGR